MASNDAMGFDGMIPFDKIKQEKTEEFQTSHCQVCKKSFTSLEDLSHHNRTHHTNSGDSATIKKMAAGSGYLNYFDLTPKLEIHEDQVAVDNSQSIDAASVTTASSNISNVTIKREDDVQSLDPQFIKTEAEEDIIVEIKKEAPVLYFRYLNIPQENDSEGCSSLSSNSTFADPPSVVKIEISENVNNLCNQGTNGNQIGDTSVKKTEISIEQIKDGSNLAEVKKEDTPKVFTCRLCKEKFAKKYQRTKHMRVHIGELEFKCYICSFKSFERRLLNIHMDDHITGNPYACHLCEYKCKDKSTLIKHVKSHAGEKPYACTYCDYRTKSREHLKLHVRRHTGDKPYACHLCDYKAARKSILVVHLRVHTGEKPYTCDVCDLKFNQRCHLISHTRVHTGLRPFTCDVCGYKCRQSSNLKVHMRVHTGEKPYACCVCKQKFNQKSVLSAHMKRHKDNMQTVCCDK